MSLDESKDGYIDNILQVPCLRRSLLYGIGGGVGAGLLRFLFTSNVSKSSHFGFWSYIGLTVCIWTHCRFTSSAQVLQSRLYKEGLEKVVLTEGTDITYRDSSPEDINIPKNA